MTWWVAGAAVVTGAYGANRSEKAAGQAKKGNDKAIAESARQFDVMYGLNRPGIVTGTGALNKLARLYGIPYQEFADPQGYGGGDAGILTKRFGGSSGWEDLTSGKIGNLGIGRHGREATFAPGPGQAFSARQVSKMLKQGMSLAEIDAAGKLETSLNPRRLNKLANKRGLTPEQIQRLQYGKGGAPGQAGKGLDKNGMPKIVTPDGPDMSEFIESPDYQFNKTEGLSAVDRSAAARSGALSGNAVRAGEEFASGLASREFGNFFERLMRIAGLGGAATNNATAAAASTGGNITQLLAQQGDARASGTMGAANSVTGALNTGLNAYLLGRGGYFDRPAVG